MTTMYPKSIDQITRVEVSGFRNFPKNFAVELGTSTVIIGENGTGKTNFCEFLKFISGRIGHAWERPYCETILGGNVFAYNQPCDIKWSIAVDSKEGSFGLHDGFIKDDRDGYKVDSREKREAARRFFRKWEIHSGKPLDFIETVRPIGLSSMKEENPGLFREIDHVFHLAVSDSSLSLESEETIRKLPESLRRFVRLATICLTPAVSTPPTTAPAVDGSAVGAPAVGAPAVGAPAVGGSADGGLLTAGLLTAGLLTAGLLTAGPERIGLCVDTPEAGLHPRVIDILGLLLREASRHMQVILTTHSSLLLKQFSIDEIVVFGKKNGTLKATRPSEKASKLIGPKSVEILEKMFVSGELEEL